MAETVQQKSKRLRKRKERSHARRAAQTASDRQATLQWKSTCERERMASETPAEREVRLQWMRYRVAAETPEETEVRLHVHISVLTFENTPLESSAPQGGYFDIPLRCLQIGFCLRNNSKCCLPSPLCSLNNPLNI